MDDLGASRQFILQPLVIVATSSPEIHAMQKNSISASLLPTDGHYGNPSYPPSSCSSEPCLPQLFSQLMLLPNQGGNREREKHERMKDGMNLLSFPRHIFDSTSSDDDDKENILPPRWISKRTTCDINRVNEERCSASRTTPSKHRRLSYDRLPRLEEIGKGALLSAASNTSTYVE